MIVVVVHTRWDLTVFWNRSWWWLLCKLLQFVHYWLQLVQLEVLAVIRYCWRWSRAQLAVPYYYYWWLLMALLLGVMIKLVANDVTNLGMTILKTERAFNLAAGFTNKDDRLPEFFAEDLLRGFRVDVWDDVSKEWHPLCARDGRGIIVTIIAARRDIDLGNGAEVG